MCSAKHVSRAVSRIGNGYYSGFQGHTWLASWQALAGVIGRYSTFILASLAFAAALRLAG